jgi:hypothetical protein|tara:strand:- start:779 stop:1159 length:381 start_codon:yes stop_codon:yes gene_type:complete
MELLNYKGFNRLNEEKENETIKKMVLDYAEKNKKSTWKELQNLILKHKGLDPNDRANRGQFASYFSGGSWLVNQQGWDKKDRGKHGRSHQSHGLLMRPTKKDPRYLEKDGKHYIVKKWDGKSDLEN